MSDADGDGIYEIVVPRKKAFNSFYTFTNGPCPDYSCKENLEGLPCGNPNNFNDRFLPEVANDITVATCFGACFTNAECVSAISEPFEDPRLFVLLNNPPGANAAALRFETALQEDKIITLTNAIGQVAGQWMAPGGATRFQVETADLPAGFYFVTVQAGNRFLTRKLVK